MNVALTYTHYGAIASLCIKNTLTEGNLSSEGTVSGSASEISQKLYIRIYVYSVLRRNRYPMTRQVDVYGALRGQKGAGEQDV